MTSEIPLSAKIDVENYRFSNAVKAKILSGLSALSDKKLEWLVIEHYQFSKANVDLLQAAVRCTAALADERVSAELQRNVEEEDGHAPMYKQGMLNIGTDMERRVEFPPTSVFLRKMRDLASTNSSRALGVLYASETAAIFEHEVFDLICAQLAARRGHAYEGSLIKEFHDIHLGGGVEQGHKDGLSALIDFGDNVFPRRGEPIDHEALYAGAIESIRSMQMWWQDLLEVVFSRAAPEHLVPIVDS